MVELAQAMEEADGAGYASYVSKGKTYNGGKVERELEEVLETTQDYCKKVDCDQLFVAR